jgi:hypothetical protein
MPKVTVLAIAIGTVTMFFAFGAGALPLTPVKSQPVVESNMTLVRDGCGRGYYYSERWGDASKRAITTVDIIDVNIAKRVASTIVGRDARTAILGEEAISTVAGSHTKPALPLADKR